MNCTLMPDLGSRHLFGSLLGWFPAMFGQAALLLNH
jgi:hypothetical protein